jgi:hypothetical protein
LNGSADLRDDPRHGNYDASEPMAAGVDPLTPPPGPGVYTASNGWMIAVAGSLPQKSIDELGAEAEVDDLEQRVREGQELIRRLQDWGCDDVTAERRMLAEDEADLDRARRDLAMLRAPRPGRPPIGRRRVSVGARPRERRPGRRRRAVARAGPDGEDPDPAGGRDREPDLAGSVA